MDYRHRLIVAKLQEGCGYAQAAAAAGVHRQSLWRWVSGSTEFAAAVAAAYSIGRDEREYRLWLRHPFRGKRPPASKMHGGQPKYSYGRRG
jgi:hypothetical protein